MKINSQQLSTYLTKNSCRLFLVSGDEYLLVQDACDTIRNHAKKMGYDVREIFHIETGFNWEFFLSSVNNTSLFSDKTLIELRLKNKLTDNGSKIIQNYAKNPADDKIILIITNKLDATQQKTAWFKALETHGMVLPIWPLDTTQLPLWLKNRLQLAGLKTTSQGIQLLVEYTSGNLLAAIQEIEKLRLLYGSGDLTIEQISAAITDNARFNVFNLLDATMNNKITAVTRILNNLKNENIEPTLILWGIVHELRTLLNINFALQQGINIEQALLQNNVWHNRKPLIKKTVQKYNLTQLQNLLNSATTIDLIIKGANQQHLLWHDLEKLYLRFATSNNQSKRNAAYFGVCE